MIKQLTTLFYILFLFPFSTFCQKQNQDYATLNPFNNLPFKNFELNKYGNKSYKISIGEFLEWGDTLQMKKNQLLKYDTLIIDPVYNNLSAISENNRTVIVYGIAVFGANDETRTWNESCPNKEFINIIDKILILDSNNLKILELDYLDYYIGKIEITQDNRYLAFSHHSGYMPNDNFSEGLKIIDIYNKKLVYTTNEEWSIAGRTDSLIIASRRINRNDREYCIIDIQNKILYKKTIANIDVYHIAIESNGLKFTNRINNKFTFESYVEFDRTKF